MGVLHRAILEQTITAEVPGLRAEPGAARGVNEAIDYSFSENDNQWRQEVCQEYLYIFWQAKNPGENGRPFFLAREKESEQKQGREGAGECAHWALE
jgi:hypothetical protein